MKYGTAITWTFSCLGSVRPNKDPDYYLYTIRVFQDLIGPLYNGYCMYMKRESAPYETDICSILYNSYRQRLTTIILDSARPAV